MLNIYPVFQPPASQFYTGYTTICEDFYPLNGRRRRRTLPVHHIYVLLDLQYMIAADIILSRVMIKPDYAEKNNDADQPTHLHHIWPKTCTTFHPLAFVTSYIALVTAGNTQVISICYLS